MFEIICEVQPAIRPDLTGVRHQIGVMSKVASAFLIPDNHIGRATVSSVAVAHEVDLMGGRAIACLNARDRNLLGFRRDLLTAAAYNVDEFLFVFGDRPKSGRRAEELTVRSMMDETRDFSEQSRREVRIGVTTRLGDLPEWKISADFLFVQVSFELDALLRWRERTAFDGKVYAGVLVPPSAARARKWVEEIPEISVSESWIHAIDARSEAGIDSACTLVDSIRGSGAFDGVHLVPGVRYREVAHRLEDGRPTSAPNGQGAPHRVERASSPTQSGSPCRRASGRTRTSSGGCNTSRRPAMRDPQVSQAAEIHRTLRQVPLAVAGATGFVGSLCVLVGVAQSGSPFTSKLPNAWFFGLGTGASGAGQDGTYLGVIIVYLGVALMIASWFEVVRTLRRNPATPVRVVMAIIVAWAVPVLVMPPLFSRDVYSYAAQGEMVSRGLNPYIQGPTALGPNPYLRLVDPIWQSAHAPYGPAWERLAGGIVQLARHDVVATIVGFRLVALIGVGADCLGCSGSGPIRWA